jgi:Cft2 family RNA processing exonuclease
MKAVVLGGTNVGASCVAVEVHNKWIVVDAGISMNPNADRLPDFAFLDDKPLAAIFVTHAHADHIGALPVLHQQFPFVPVYCSRATMHLMRIMLEDALTIMTKRADADLEVPLYTEEMVEALLHHLHPVPIGTTVTIPQMPGVSISLTRAGHVAGAVSILIDAGQIGKLWLSGDISITPQRTLLGAELPPVQRPDLLILESTYGNRMHPNRQLEEQRLIEAVVHGIERGGHVLIPAFALGRAQEVIRILSEAQRDHQGPRFPIWIDGLVRRVSTAYTAIPSALAPTLCRQIERGYPPFLVGPVRQVEAASQRERILAGEPSCIISSSGMLTGGPSVFYATHLAADPRASILITGYQDEEAPGRKLLALADQSGDAERMLDVGGYTVPVRCHFAKYSLSAHADADELVRLVAELQPKQVALVHGDDEARQALASELERLTEPLVPAIGAVLPVNRPSQRRQRKQAERGSQEHLQVAATGIGNGAVFTPESIYNLWRVLVDDASLVQTRKQSFKKCSAPTRCISCPLPTCREHSASGLHTRRRQRTSSLPRLLPRRSSRELWCSYTSMISWHLRCVSMFRTALCGCNRQKPEIDGNASAAR